MRKNSKILFALALGILVAGCPVRNSSSDTYSPNYDGGDIDAGNEGLSIADCQDTTSSKYPGAEAVVNLVDRVVTTQLYTIDSSTEGFFISDPAGGEYSGVLVVVPAGQVTVALHDVVDIQGTLTEYRGDNDNAGTDTQIRATQVTLRSSGTVMDPTVVTPALLAEDDTAEAWEGVLVKVENVSVELYLDGSLTENGKFQVTGLAEVDDTLFTYVPGRSEVFNFIIGVVHYNYYGDFVILPRSAEDISSQSGARVDSTPAKIQNPDDPDRPDVCATTSLECAPVKLTNMVVVSPVYGASREQSGTCLDGEEDYGKCPYYLYSFFIADPADVDSNGRLNAWAGIKVSVTPGARWIRGTECDGLTGDDLINCGEAGYIYDRFSTNYTFDGHFRPTAVSQTVDHGFPQVGDIVDIDGEPAEYYDMTQLHSLLELTRKGSTNDTNPLVQMPLPALFDGDVEAIISGTTRVPATGEPVLREELDPGVDMEKYEGVLVELANVTTLDACVGYVDTRYPDQGMVDFDYFRVAGASATPLHGVEIGTLFFTPWDDWGGWWRSPSSGGPAYEDRVCSNTENKCDDYRTQGQTFSSIIGVIDYSYGIHRLEPFGRSSISCATGCDMNPNPSHCE